MTFADGRVLLLCRHPITCASTVRVQCQRAVPAWLCSRGQTPTWRTRLLAGQTIRQATEADLHAIGEIITAAYSMYLTRLDTPPAPMLRDYAPAVLHGEVWVAGIPVTGLISLIPADDSLLIENLAVHPAAQGAGLGRALMDFAEQQARRLGLPRLALYTNEVMTENQAIYTHLGYRETARRSEDGYSRVFMQKELPTA